MTSGIYKITNTATKKVYIGSAVDISARWAIHLSQLAQNKHHSPHLQKAWNKYGEESFTFEIIETIEDIQHLISREQIWIDFYGAAERKHGYNICPLAGSVLGLKFTEEQRKRLSESHIGIKQTPETREKISKAHKGKPKPWLQGRVLTEEHKEKLRAASKHLSPSPESIEATKRANTGKIRTQEHKDNLSKALKGRIISEESREKMSKTRKGKAMPEGFGEKIKASWVERRRKKEEAKNAEKEKREVPLV